MAAGGSTRLRCYIGYYTTIHQSTCTPHWEDKEYVHQSWFRKHSSSAIQPELLKLVSSDISSFAHSSETFANHAFHVKRGSPIPCWGTFKECVTQMITSFPDGNPQSLRQFYKKTYLKSWWLFIFVQNKYKNIKGKKNTLLHIFKCSNQRYSISKILANRNTSATVQSVCKDNNHVKWRIFF